jgi:hypothetical protein
MVKIGQIVIALLALPALAACSGVLGIEPAELDPRLQGSGGKAGTGGTAGASAVDAGQGAVSCAEYCGVLQKNCTAPTEVFVSVAGCLAACKTLPLGTRADTSGNTVGCRLHYATSAGTIGEKDANCSAAGPGGNSVCGTNCDGFCSIVQATCSGIYATERICNLACERIPDKQSYNDTILTGNSVQCRLYHASAATVDQALHCPHTDFAKPGPCGPAQ